MRLGSLRPLLIKTEPDNKNQQQATPTDMTMNASIPEESQGSATAAALPTTALHERGTTSFAWRHSPTVQAVLSGNTLSSCDQVESLYHECMTSGSDDMICNVATHAYSMCTKGYIEADASDANKIILRRNTD